MIGGWFYNAKLVSEVQKLKYEVQKLKHVAHLKTHVVQEGETLKSIATLYGLSDAVLAQINLLTSTTSYVYPGQVIWLEPLKSKVISGEEEAENSQTPSIQAKICLTGSTIRHIRHCIQMF